MSNTLTKIFVKTKVSCAFVVICLLCELQMDFFLSFFWKWVRSWSRWGPAHCLKCNQRKAIILSYTTDRLHLLLGAATIIILITRLVLCFVCVSMPPAVRPSDWEVDMGSLVCIMVLLVCAVHTQVRRALMRICSRALVTWKNCKIAKATGCRVYHISQPATNFDKGVTGLLNKYLAVLACGKCNPLPPPPPIHTHTHTYTQNLILRYI